MNPKVKKISLSQKQSRLSPRTFSHGFKMKRFSFRIPSPTKPHEDSIETLKNFIPTTEGIFGRELDVKDSEIPIFLDCLYDFLLKFGKHSKLLFSKNGNLETVEKIITEINKTEEFDFEKLLESEDNYIHTCAQVLKIFFKRMPEPLISYELYDELIEICQFESLIKRKNRIRFLFLEYLSPQKYQVSQKLFKFLNKFSKFTDSTDMTLGHLAFGFGLHLLKPNEITFGRILKNSKQINCVISTLIQFYEYIFEKKEIDSEDDGKKEKGISESEKRDTILERVILCKEGYLVKEGKIRKSWRKRYFRLYSNHYLRYFKTQNSKDPRGSIPLFNASIIKLDYKKQFCIAISSNFYQRTYYISLSSEDERNSWIYSINKYNKVIEKNDI